MKKAVKTDFVVKPPSGFPCVWISVMFRKLTFSVQSNNHIHNTKRVGQSAAKGWSKLERGLGGRSGGTAGKCTLMMDDGIVITNNVQYVIDSKVWFGTCFNSLLISLMFSIVH
jgi:hypothetical protein